MVGLPERRLLKTLLLDSRFIVGSLLLVAGLAGAVLTVRATRVTVPVLVLAVDVKANTALADHDLAVAEVRLPEIQLRTIAPAAERLSVVGQMLLRNGRAGDLVVKSQLVSQVALRRELAVSIPADRSWVGDIQAGDRVDVVGSFFKGTPDARAIVLARAAEVVAVRDEEAAFGGSGPIGRIATLAVDGPEALAIVFAADNGSIGLVRTGGSPRPLPPSIDAASLGIAP